MIHFIKVLFAIHICKLKKIANRKLPLTAGNLQGKNELHKT